MSSEYITCNSGQSNQFKDAFERIKLKTAQNMIHTSTDF